MLSAALVMLVSLDGSGGVAQAPRPPEVSISPASLERIRKGLEQPPTAPIKIDVSSIVPIVRFKTTVTARTYVPTLQEDLNKTFALTALQRQSAQWASQCCGLNLGPLFKRLDKARKERAARKLREQIQRDLAAIEAARKTKQTH